MLIIASIIGLLGGAEINKAGSIVGLVLGIVILFIAVFAANNPILITIILGIALIAYGVVYSSFFFFYFDFSLKTLFLNYINGKKVIIKTIV